MGEKTLRKKLSRKVQKTWKKNPQEFFPAKTNTMRTEPWDNTNPRQGGQMIAPLTSCFKGTRAERNVEDNSQRVRSSAASPTWRSRRAGSAPRAVAGERILPEPT
jgi:hypothetical protein